MTRMEELLEDFNTHDKALARIAELEAALTRALGYCDGALHQDNQYADERGDLIRVLHND